MLVLVLDRRFALLVLALALALDQRFALRPASMTSGHARDDDIMSCPE